jgi:type VI secretion system secreted protein VgrG
MATYTQANRLIAITTPLGEDGLLLQSLSGREGMSQLFSYELELLSEDPGIPFAQIVGQRATVAIRLGDGSERCINGFINRFSQSGSDDRFTYYQAELVPWLWLLTRTADCRIFQNMTVPDIIEKIFKDLGFTDFKNMLQGSFEPREYCVQYRETDFNFVSRLMEQYGIFYFFEHEENKHTLVLANSPSAHPPCPGQEYARLDYNENAMLDEDLISSWHKEQELRPGKYALTDYNFETPSTSLAVNVNTTISVNGNSKYEIYDYPGEYLKKAQGNDLVKLRMEEEEAMHTVLTGTSTCRAFLSGYRFDLEGHSSDAMNATYLLTEVQHAASVGDGYDTSTAAGGEAHYTNSFTCMPYDVPYRPQRLTPKPIVQGPQTATVVGKAGEEIWTDKFGRVKVQFHWDREGRRDENSSCWIRVSHPWAGKGWGAVSIPRMGQEVIVDFLEGDPDQPIITGRVYNAEQMPPYGLPANQTQSGVKSRSSKEGTPDNFNEIRFEDKKGEEQLFIHAEKNQDIEVENDETHWVGRDRRKTIDQDETTEVKRDRTETVGRNESITIGDNRTEKVGKDESITIGDNRTEKVGKDESITIGDNRTEKVGKDESITIGDNRTENVGKNESITIGDNRTEKVGKDESITIGDNRTENVGKDETVSVGNNRSHRIGDNDALSVGKVLSITAGDQITIKTGSASIIMKKDGTITIQGKDITVKGSGKITINANNDIIMKGQKILQN